MDKCGRCGALLPRGERLATHIHIVGDAPIELIDSALSVRCAQCGETAVVIPNLTGLIAAVAISRALQSTRLRGRDVRFLRRSLEVTGKRLSELLQVSAEAISRWENGAQPMSPQNEILFRMVVISALREKAPAMEADVDDVLRLKLSPFDEVANDEPLKFELVRFKREGKKARHWDTSDDLAA